MWLVVLLLMNYLGFWLNNVIKIIQALLLRNVNFDETNVNQKVTQDNRVLKSLRCNNLNKLVFAHLNINSIRNKFEIPSEQVRGNVDVLMVSETKKDDSFLFGYFLIHGFSPPYRLDRDSKGGGIILYIREDIPSNLLATGKEPIEILCWDKPLEWKIFDKIVPIILIKRW